MGFPQYICDWIRNWLTDRKFAVRNDNCLSDVYTITSGVPQGSVLGPILFNLYTADLATDLRETSICFHLYADDIKIYSSFDRKENGRHNHQKAINIVDDWSKMWQLPLAPKKCQVLYLGRQNPKFNYKLDGKTLKKTKEVEDLGFIINEKLDFSKYIGRPVNKARKRTFTIFRTMKTKKMKVLLRAYTMYVRSILESGSVVFNPSRKTDKLRVERMQNAFTRRIFMRCKLLKYSETPSSLARNTELKLDSLDLRRYRADMKMMQRILNGKCGISSGDFYSFRTTRTRGAVRKLKVQRTDSSFDLIRSHFVQLKAILLYRYVMSYNNSTPYYCFLLFLYNIGITL